MNKEEVFDWAKRMADSKTVAALLGAIAGFAAAFLVLERNKGQGEGGGRNDHGCLCILAAMATFVLALLGVGFLGFSWPIIALIGTIAIVVLTVIGGRNA